LVYLAENCISEPDGRTNMSYLIVKFVIILGLLGFQPLLTVYAQEEKVVVRNEAVVDYPETVTFQLELVTNEPITGATLTYHLGQDGCLEAGTQVPVEINGTKLEWQWVMSRSGNPPPGAEMTWYWTGAGPNDATFTTASKKMTFTDERFDWRTVEATSQDGQAPIQLHWYKGDDVGPVLLEAAVSGLDRLQQDTGIQLEGDVEIFIYGDSADMRDALLYVQDWAGGVAFSEYNTILIGVPPYLADDWGSRTVRHELAHLVVGQYARSCLGGSLPTWLSEGLAVYAEGDPDQQTLDDLEDGLSNDSFQPVRSLNGSFPARGEAATSAYSQSYSLVSFLLETYGQDKMQELLLALAGAAGYDSALEQVYGFNVDGLEVAWREATKAQPRLILPTPTRLVAAAIPTVKPLNAAKDWPTPQSQASLVETPTPQQDFLANDAGSTCSLGLAPLLLMAGITTYSLKTRNGTKKAIES
jgi:hypothetical protein